MDDQPVPDNDQLNNTGLNEARPEPTPEARRALAEAKARQDKAQEDKARSAQADGAAALPREINGRGGLEPIRYGDWEVKGLTSDF